MRRIITIILLAAFFIAAGLNHFRDSHLYLDMMPNYLPWHLPLVWISGFAEIAGGVGILFPKFRRAAATGLILLLICVFPANIHVALNGFNHQGYDVPTWVLWVRLPFQLLFIYIVWKVALPKRHKADLITI